MWFDAYENPGWRAGNGGFRRHDIAADFRRLADLGGGDHTKQT
jgi:hypothetical protein